MSQISRKRKSDDVVCRKCGRRVVDGSHKPPQRLKLGHIADPVKRSEYLAEMKRQTSRESAR